MVFAMWLLTKLNPIEMLCKIQQTFKTHQSLPFFSECTDVLTQFRSVAFPFLSSKQTTANSEKMFEKSGRQKLTRCDGCRLVSVVANPSTVS
jgi:hypothetical protein